MKILVIGSGGREHALCWRLARDGHSVHAMPGSVGIGAVATCHAGDISNLATTVETARSLETELVVIGPEVPLVLGLADRLRESGIATFGPGAAGAKLEGSKIYSKSFFARHGIRSAAFFACATMDEVDAALKTLGERVVVKADGLAAGKGVVVCASAHEARDAARSMLDASLFGQAGSKIVVEERIDGRELSVMALCDGKRCEVLAQAEDHKAMFDGDVGPNTGGMGTVSPPSWAGAELLAKVQHSLLGPTITGLQAEGIDFRGVLYAGVMVDADGNPWLLEYNVRFGDPETQPVVMRMKSDLGRWLAGAAHGQLPDGHIDWDERAAVCVVMASAGYPNVARTGDAITGIEVANQQADTMVFYAGAGAGSAGLETTGGRVLGVTSMGATPKLAAEAAYSGVRKIHFDGMQFRNDIGSRGE